MSVEKDLSNYRLEQAELCLKAAKNSFENDDYYTASNRSYYCVFNGIRSLLALERIDFRTHSGVIDYFRKTYIKTGILEVRLSDIIKSLFMKRNVSDYEAFVVISKEDITKQIDNAEYFLSKIKDHLNKIGNK
jgi:uncharacterized protein (UPF0332 family)